MRIVRDEEGRRYLQRKRSSDASLVRDLKTGETRYVENRRLEPVEGIDPTVKAAGSLTPEARRSLRPIADDRTLGLLVLVARNGPIPVRDLLDLLDLCESDLHGAVSELRAAGLLSETDVAGVRGYEVTDRARTALSSDRE